MTNSEGSFSGWDCEAAVRTKPVHLNDILATIRVSPTHTLVDSMKHAAFINQQDPANVSVSMSVSVSVSVNVSVSVSMSMNMSISINVNMSVNVNMSTSVSEV